MPQGKLKANRVMMQCTTAVKPDAVRRETINGIEHIIISSHTLPENIVMNGILYPAEEVAAGIHTLERTLAPVEHPSDADGNFISASDPEAIHNFHAGAFNTNVRKEGNRFAVDKTINVQEAMKTDRGKRLLDRIKEIETNDKARPIHTSVGAFLLVEETDGPQVNAEGQEFFGIARDIAFDHDAILLDSVGAAQPGQGVGMAVNSEGDEITVHQFMLDQEPEPTADTTIPTSDQMSQTDVRAAVQDALDRSAISDSFVVEIFDKDEIVIFEVIKDEQLFSVPFTIGNGRAEIVGIPRPMTRDVTFNPKVNSEEGDAMKDLIVNALQEAKVEIDGLSDADLFAKYNELQANQSEAIGSGSGEDKADLADFFANAVKPLVDQMASMEKQLTANKDTELDELATLIGNSDKYAGIDAKAAKAMGIDTLKSLAANCSPAYGLASHLETNQESEAHVATDLPD